MYAPQYQNPAFSPSYSATFHHPASAHPNLYQTSAYSVPTIANPPVQTMPTYYISGGSPSAHRSRSHTRHSHQPIVYTTSGSGGQQYTAPHGYSGSSRPRRSSSVGHGGHYYVSGSHHGSHRSSSRSPTYYTSGSSSSNRHRSHSTSPQYHDSGRRHSTSTHRPHVTYSDHGHSSHHHQRRHSDSLGDRFRRWFGMGPEHHTTSRNVRYEDPRTGRPVDRLGRPVYRV